MMQDQDGLGVIVEGFEPDRNEHSREKNNENGMTLDVPNDNDNDNDDEENNGEILSSHDPTIANNELMRDNIMTQKEMLKQQLYKLFEDGDKDKNDLIDRQEFKDVMIQLMPQTKERDIMDLFSTFDVENCGQIDYKELLYQDAFDDFIN
ncbi:hypothetical protein RFI_20761, partial [Reticulomyxa filosa]